MKIYNSSNRTAKTLLSWSLYWHGKGIIYIKFKSFLLYTVATFSLSCYKLKRTLAAIPHLKIPLFYTIYFFSLLYYMWQNFCIFHVSLDFIIHKKELKQQNKHIMHFDFKSILSNPDLMLEIANGNKIMRSQNWSK